MCTRKAPRPDFGVVPSWEGTRGECFFTLKELLQFWRLDDAGEFLRPLFLLSVVRDLSSCFFLTFFLSFISVSPFLNLYLSFLFFSLFSCLSLGLV